MAKSSQSSDANAIEYFRGLKKYKLRMKLILSLDKVSMKFRKIWGLILVDFGKF